MNQPYEALNTDWFGTIQAEAILWWANPASPEEVTYTTWAVPAEQRQLEMDTDYHGFIPGIVMMAAAQILK